MALLEIDQKNVQRIGAISPGNEEMHYSPDSEIDRLTNFEAACEILFVPYIDEETLTEVYPSVVEVITSDDNYIIVKDSDRQGDPTLSILTRKDLRNHAVSVIQTPEGKYVEQHDFRVTFGFIRESESYPLEPNQFEIFDRISDAIFQPTSSIVILL